MKPIPSLQNITAIERILADMERRYGILDSRAISYRRNLTHLYQVRGRVDKAAELVEREIAALEEIEGPNSSNLLSKFDHLVSIYRNANLVKQAKAVLDRSHAIQGRQSLRRMRPPPPLVPNKRRKPASVPPPIVVRKAITVSPKMVEAVPMQTRPRGLPVNGATETKAQTKLSVKGNRPTIADLQYLAKAEQLDREARDLWWQERPSDAEKRYREALQFRISVFGPDHVDIAGSLLRLARVLWSRNEFKEAAALHQRVIAILERSSHEDSIYLAEVRWELGGYLQIRGYYNDAQTLMSKALAVFEAQAAEYSKISLRRATYETLLRDLGRADEATVIRR